MRTITRAKEENGEVMGLAVQSGGRGMKGRGDGKEESVTCTYCNRTGHEAENCFKLIGYPDWWGERKIEGKGSGRAKPQHQIGNGRGRGGIVRANAVQSSGTSTGTNDKMTVNGITLFG